MPNPAPAANRWARPSYMVLAYHTTSTVFLIHHVLTVQEHAIRRGRLNPQDSLWMNWRALLEDTETTRRVAQGIHNTYKTAEFSIFTVFNYAFSSYMFMIEVTKMLFLGQLTTEENNRMKDAAIGLLCSKLLFLFCMPSSQHRNLGLWLWCVAEGYVRVFMHMAQLRLDTLLAMAPPTGAHRGRMLRTLALLLWTLGLTAMGGQILWEERGSLTRSEFAMLSYDVLLAALEGGRVLLSYGVHMADRAALFHGAGSGGGFWESWDGKSSLLYHAELAADLAALSVMTMRCLHGFALHGARDLDWILVLLVLYLRRLVTKIRKRVSGYLEYRAATHNLNHTFPAASPADIHAAGGECAICCEPMTSAKQLPCSHVFHTSCLQAWLQQNGGNNFTCPICRCPLSLDHQQNNQHGAPVATRRVADVVRDMLLYVLIGTPWPQPLSAQEATSVAPTRVEHPATSSEDVALEQDSAYTASDDDTCSASGSRDISISYRLAAHFDAGHRADSWGTTVSGPSSRQRELSSASGLLAAFRGSVRSHQPEGRSGSATAAASSHQLSMDPCGELADEVQSPGPQARRRSWLPPVRSSQGVGTRHPRETQGAPDQLSGGADDVPQRPPSSALSPAASAPIVPPPHAYNTRQSAKMRAASQS